MRFVNTQNEHEKLLELYVDPLRCIRGLSEVNISVLNPYYGPNTNPIVDESNARSREYLIVVEEEMMMPVLEAELRDAGL